MDSVPQVVANATGSASAAVRRKTSGSMKRPTKLVKGSVAAKRWMAYVRSAKKGGKKSAKTPMRKRARKASSKKSAKTPTKKRSRKASSKKSGGRK